MGRRPWSPPGLGKRRSGLENPRLASAAAGGLGCSGRVRNADGRERRTWALRGACLGVFALWSSPALPRPMDPALSRLVVDPSCQAAGGGPCVPDRASYAKLVSQLGFALAAPSVHSARTHGLASFDVAALASLTSIESSADYWRRGSRGGAGAGENGAPEPFLQLYALELRKGFGFGLEAAASLGALPHTSLVAWGADVRLALLEGLRESWFEHLPDASVGLALRRGTGLGELRLGTLAVDARLSHPFVSPGAFSVTPWIGYQWLRIAGDTELVDLTPGVPALAQCGYAGSNLPGGVVGPEAASARPVSGAPDGTYDGAPTCSGSGADLGSSASFGEVTVHRHRIVLGASLRRELLTVGAQLVTDLPNPDAAQPDAAVARSLRCDASGTRCGAAPRQWTWVVRLGASF